MVASDHRTVHSQTFKLAGEASVTIELKLDEDQRRYSLLLADVSFDQLSPNVLLTLWNYYQRLITPPIVAAPQFELDLNCTSCTATRSMPGLGKLNGRIECAVCFSDQSELDKTPLNTYREFLRQASPQISSLNNTSFQS